MKAYVLYIKHRRFDEPTVRVYFTIGECSRDIIALANNLLKDGTHVDTLGSALRFLDNEGIDVYTYPVDVELPTLGEPYTTETAPHPLLVGAQSVIPAAADFCDVCGADITAVQARLSRARRDGADKACQDCVTKELSKPDFEQALANFLASIRELVEAHYAKNYPRLTPPTFTVDPGGQKYLRIVQNDGAGQTGSRSVYCFVDKATGDILKADGWKRPAKRARGSIYDNAGKGAITPYGVHYITKRDKREARIRLDVRAEIEGRK